jgi:hypothetical protein
MTTEKTSAPPGTRATLARLGMAAVAAICLAPPTCAEQVTVQSVHVQGPDDSGLSHSKLDELDEHFATGDFETARRLGREILDAAAKASKPAAYDYRRNAVVLLWLGTDASGAGVLRRLLLSSPSSNPFSGDLPGLRPGREPPELYEVLLTLDKRSTATSQYTFTREANPILAEIPSAVEAIAGPLFGLVAAVRPLRGPRGVVVERERVPPISIWATASRVPVPLARARVAVKTIAQIPISTDEWRSDVDRLAVKLAFELVPRSKPARDCIEVYQHEAISVAKSESCSGEHASAGACRSAFDSALTTAYERCLGRGLGEDDSKALQLVDDKYRELVAAGRATRVEGSAELRNTPRTHFGFGLGAALVLHASLSEDRVKLDDSGLLVRDPLPRQMTMVMLHWSPAGYDADSPKIQASERWRLFAAGVLTPDFGVAAGGSMLVVRGLGVNAGAGLLFSKARNGGDEIGSPPSNATDAYGVAKAWVVFTGINVSFK